MAETNVAAEGPPAGGSGFGSMPSTRLGRAAVWLAAVFVAMFGVNALVFTTTSWADTTWRRYVLPAYAITMLGCGLAASVCSLIAIIRKSERSWMLWLTTIPGLLIAIFLVGEFLFPH